MNPVLRRWAPAAAVAASTTGLGVAINFATELKHNGWAWFAVGLLTLAGTALGVQVHRRRQAPEVPSSPSADAMPAPPTVNRGTSVMVSGQHNKVRVVSNGSGFLIAVNVVVILAVVAGMLVGRSGGDSSPADEHPPARDEPFAVTVQTDPREADFGAALGSGEDYVFPSGVLTSVPAPEPAGRCEQWQRWAEQHGGVRTGVAGVTFTVAALDSAVRVHGARLVVERQQQPATGDRVLCQKGGPIDISYLSIDLDNETALFRYSGDSLNAGQERPLALQIAPDKAERVAVKAHSMECFCRWYLELRLEVDGTEYPYRVDNKGQPFVTAPQFGSYTDYQYDTASRRWRPYP